VFKAKQQFSKHLVSVAPTFDNTNVDVGIVIPVLQMKLKVGFSK